MKLVRAAWNDRAAHSLREAMGGDADYIRHEVISGGATLWDCVGCGWLVTRLEDQELVFVAGAGVNAKEVIGLFMKNKKKLKCTSCRIHSARRGMGKYLHGLGFREVERVYRVVM